MNRHASLALAAFIGVLMGCCARIDETTALSAASVQQRSTGAPSHLLVTLQVSPAGLAVVNLVTVAQPLPRMRVPEHHPWRVTFRTADHQVLFEQEVPRANEVRSETMGDAGEMITEHETRTTSTFAVRLPHASGTVELTQGQLTLGTAVVNPR